MHVLKKSVLIMIFGLIVGVTAGCQKRIETVFIQPECTVPSMVTEADLPDINVDKVYDHLGTETAEKLLKRERLIVDSLLEHRAIVKELCQTPEK